MPVREGSRSGGSKGSRPRVYVDGPDGKRVPLSSLPLVAYALNCGHLGRDYAVKRRDLVFCDDCQDSRRVSRILAQ